MSSKSAMAANVAAERQLLGVVLNDGLRFHDAAVVVRAEDFFDPRHARVFGAVAALVEDGSKVSEQTVRLKLGRDLAQVGEDYLVELVYQAPDPDALDVFARTVRDAAVRRDAAQAHRSLAALAASADVTTPKFLEQQEAEFARLLGRHAGAQAYRPTATVVDAVEREADRIASGELEIPGVPTGLPSLDRATRGLRPGQLVVIGGGTSDGKSALAGTIAKHAAERGFRGAIFTMEMTTEDWISRLVSSEGINQADQTSASFLRDPRNRDRLRAIRARIAGLPLEFVDMPGITFPQIRTWCRRLSATAPIDFVVVDYLDLMGSHEKHDRHDLELGARARGLMAMAGELRCPVVLLVQLNREALRDAGNGPKRRAPELRHVAGSFEVVRHAHLVLLLHALTSPESPEGDDGTREIIIAKARNGIRYRRVHAKLFGDRFTFAELAPPSFADAVSGKAPSRANPFDDSDDWGAT